MGISFLKNYNECLWRKLTFLGRDLPKATAGVEQNSPMFTPGVANWDFSLTTAMSQLATSWQPAAVAKPFTLAITGTGSFWIKVITCMHQRKWSVSAQHLSSGYYITCNCFSPLMCAFFSFDNCNLVKKVSFLQSLFSCTGPLLFQ